MSVSLRVMSGFFFLRLSQVKILIVLNSCLMCSSALLTGFSTLFRSVSVLCAERVSQMTKTYNDIDAVTRLLEEVKIKKKIMCIYYDARVWGQ